MATIAPAADTSKAGGSDPRYVYRFGGGVSDGGAGDRNLLGGKGANLAEMASIGLPVPPGFTISTEMCTRYYDEGGAFPASVREEVANGLTHIEGITGKLFGDAENPLLVSVRSGARASMPGMMDTVLNLGLNDATVAKGSPRARATSASRGTAIAVSSRCIRTWCSSSITARSRKRSRSPRRTRASPSTPR